MSLKEFSAAKLRELLPQECLEEVAKSCYGYLYIPCTPGSLYCSIDWGQYYIGQTGWPELYCKYVSLNRDRALQLFKEQQGTIPYLIKYPVNLLELRDYIYIYPRRLIISYTEEEFLEVLKGIGLETEGTNPKIVKKTLKAYRYPINVPKGIDCGQTKGTSS